MHLPEGLQHEVTRLTNWHTAPYFRNPVVALQQNLDAFIAGRHSGSIFVVFGKDLFTLCDCPGTERLLRALVNQWPATGTEFEAPSFSVQIEYIYDKPWYEIHAEVHKGLQRMSRHCDPFDGNIFICVGTNGMVERL